MNMRITRKMRFKSHRGVLDAGIIILGGIVAIIAIIAATLAWSDILEVSFTNLMIEMPKFEYDISNGQETGNRNFELYQLLRNVALIALLFVIVFAGISFAFEHINWVPPETAYQILSKSILYVFFFFFFPPLWDLLATAVEQTSLWILNPENQEHQSANVEILLTKLGTIESPEFTLDAVVAGVSDPFVGLKNMFLGSFLSAFKAVAFLLFMFITFLMGTIRLVLTTIIAIALPVILMISLLPFFRRVTRRFFDAFLGLMIAPIFSALVIIAGVAHLQTIEANNPDPLVEWFASLAVMALAATIPVMVVPILGYVLSSASSIAAGAMTTGAIVTRWAGAGLSNSLGLLEGINKHGYIGGINTNPLILARSVSSKVDQLPMPTISMQQTGQLAKSFRLAQGILSNVKEKTSDQFQTASNMELSRANIRNRINDEEKS